MPGDDTPARGQALLAEQLAYYRALSAEFEDHAIISPERNAFTGPAVEALEATCAGSDVLELACGLPRGPSCCCAPPRA